MVEAAQKCAADFQIPSVYQDHRAILEDKAVEAVIICSSTDTHARFIVEAAAAGKHIFCEKPIALDLGVIDEALAAVDRAGVTLQRRAVRGPGRTARSKPTTW
jgi:myo-inositol 2-dehydrogenase/D-chiro-inositol 1-dehydrogenase